MQAFVLHSEAKYGLAYFPTQRCQRRNIAKEERTVIQLRRFILLPWLLSSAVMFGLSYVWHGLVLSDLEDLKIPLALYFVLAILVYLVLGLGLTIAAHKAVQYEFISLKKAFPFMVMLMAAATGFFVYIVVYVLGMSFMKSEGVHVVIDVLWQMVEQGLGGLMVSLGMIYDMHQRFLEQERAS